MVRLDSDVQGLLDQAREKASSIDVRVHSQALVLAVEALCTQLELLRISVKN